MSKTNIRVGQLVGLGSLLLILAWLLPPDLAVAAGLAGFAAFGAVGTVEENLSETTTPDDNLVRDVSDALTYLDQTQETPLDQFMRRMPKRKKPVRNKIIEFFQVDAAPPRIDTVNGGIGPGGADAVLQITVTNGSMWRPKDMIWIPDNATNPGGLLYITARAGNVLDVLFLPPQATKTSVPVAYGTVPALANGEKLYRIAAAKTESDHPMKSRLTTSVPDFNFIQTFDALVQASDHRQRTLNYGPDDWGRVRSSNLLDFRRSWEYSALWGERTITKDKDNDELLLTQRGITRYPIGTITYDLNTLSEADVMAIAEQVFVGNSGSKTRAWFAGSKLALALSLIQLDKMQNNPTRMVAGVRTRRIATDFGNLMVVHHPGFDALEQNTKGLIVDLANCRKCVMQDTEKRKQEYKTTGGPDADAEQYIEKSCIEVTNFDAHFNTEPV